jgi:hypothetical protein
MKQNHFRLFAILIGLLVCAGAGYGVYHFAQVPADGHFVDPAFAPPLADSAGRVVVYVAGEPILKAIEEQRVVLKRKAGDAPVAASEIVASLNERDGVRLAKVPLMLGLAALAGGAFVLFLIGLFTPLISALKPPMIVDLHLEE